MKRSYAFHLSKDERFFSVFEAHEPPVMLQPQPFQRSMLEEPLFTAKKAAYYSAVMTYNVCVHDSLLVKKKKERKKELRRCVQRI